MLPPACRETGRRPPPSWQRWVRTNGHPMKKKKRLPLPDGPDAAGAAGEGVGGSGVRRRSSGEQQLAPRLRLLEKSPVTTFFGGFFG